MAIGKLSSRNFSVSGTTKKTMNLLGVQGQALVFFKADNNRCKGSAAFEPEFLRLASNNNMFYGIANVSEFREIPMMAKNTNTPILAVPLVIYYIEGVPKVKFNAQSLTIKNITSSIAKIQDEMHQQQQYQQQAPQQQQHGYYAPAQPKGNNPFLQQTQFNFAHTGASRPGGKSHAPRGFYYPSELGQDDRKSLFNIDDLDTQLEIPGNVTPYNTPWQNEIKSGI